MAKTRYHSAMHPMLAFYKQTWWLWLIFIGVFAALTYYVSPLFIIMIPGLIGYSIYFGVVRVSELNERERERIRALRAAELKQQAASREVVDGGAATGDGSVH